MKNIASGMMLTLLLISMSALASNIPPVRAGGTVGVKAGDWIKCTYTISGWPAGTPYPEWLKVEFLSVEGTNATVRVTMRMSNGTEPNQTMTVDVAAGGGTFQGLSGFVIPANCTTGDFIYMAGYGNVTIAGETTGTYAGATRTVVYAGFSQYGTQLTYHWDKLTGVMVEASVVSGSVTGTAKATETNMWQAETIYIRADGSIDPPTAPISTVDNVTYTLTGNITSDIDGIVVERNNIIIDGAGYAVEGTSAWGDFKGIDLSGRGNVTIKNVTLITFHDGIHLPGSNYNSIIGNNITNNEYCGIYLWFSSNNNIAGNNITNNEYGIWLRDSSDNGIVGNNVTNNRMGIEISYSSNNTLRGNHMNDNQENFGVYGQELSHFINDVDFSNTVDGKHVCYWVNRHDEVVPADAGYVAIVNSANITVKNLNLKNNREGIMLAYTKNSTITGNNITENDVFGICLWYSSSNSIVGNNITENFWYGIDLGYSSNNIILGNNITEKGVYGGISLYKSSDNIIFENNITNTSGIWLRDSSNNTISGNLLVRGGLSVSDSYGNVVVDNFVNGKPLVYLEGVSHQSVGDAGQVILVNCQNVTVENLNLSYTYIGILLWQTNNTIIQGSNITNTLRGIVLGSSSNNSISGNNITNSSDGIWLGSSSNNKISGNNIAFSWDGDGICLYESSNNTVSGNNIVDNTRPFMGSCIYLSSSSNNSILHNNFIDNLWPIRSVYSRNTWDDGYPSGGNYWTDHNPLDENKDKIGDTPYIMDENNADRYPLIYPFECYEPGYVCSPELNKDGKVNILDITIVARAYGTKPGDPNWNAVADLDTNGIINILDISLVARDYGRTI